MKRRILSLLCAIATVLGMVTVPAYAADTENVLNDATVLFEDVENLTVETDTCIDLNGYEIKGVTVQEGATLLVRDTQTDDYDVADGNLGAVTGITGAVQAADGYVAITREGAVSFHKVDLAIRSMSLRPGNAGVYYTSNFAADQVVAEAVESYGVALSVAAEPTAENLETLCGYSVLYDFAAGAASGTLLTDIMEEGKTAQENAANAATAVYGRAYIKTAEGYTFGAAVERNLQEQVEAIDAVYPSLTETQKSGILAMYNTYKAAMADWNIPNLRGEELGDTTITVPVKTENGVVTESITVEQDGMSVTVPFGALVEKSELTLTVTKKAQSDSGIEATEGQTLMPFDVHVEGVSAENTVPLTVALGKVMPENLNLGNYSIYHVEATGTNPMELVANEEAFTAHNQFKYTLDGELTLHMATFSEVAAVADIANGWKGNADHSWYLDTIKNNAQATYFEIRNADQLWSLSQIVGDMASDIEQDSFSGKTIKLLADIDLADGEEANVENKIFYPIGYWNNEGTYERKPVEERETAVSSGFYAFEGIFDGNGNTISNIYQNTWEMKGDHNWYDTIKEQYFRDGMGLFGKVYGGAVKNLTVRNFKSDGEITTTGVIAAYADFGARFENIAIFNCNPRVYNIGNGGIVGCAGWYAKEDNSKNPIVFENITVDQTNKISALWGTYDASCGGILGQYYSNSGQTGSPKNGQIHFNNCHVAAIIDVNNDVCANYQYYWYRYSGMLMGTVRANKTEGGYTVADTSDIVAKNCTYTYGSWNEYWYCELVKNSSASYTHDYQFGRLTNIDELSEIKSGETWLKEGNFALVSDDRKSVECYHIFKNSEGNLYRHFHDVADESNPEIYESFDLNGDGELNDLKEDRQRYYLPFGQVLNGLGYGVKPTYELEGFTLVEDGSVISGQKFQVKDGANLSYKPGDTVYLKDLVDLVVDKSKLSQSSLYVAASPVDENGTAHIAYSRDVENWENNYITISEDTLGVVKLVITDYFYCEPTIIHITVSKVQDPVQKFVPAENVTVTVGDTKELGELFTVIEGITIDSEKVAISGNGFTYTPNASDWTLGTVVFNSVGETDLTITDNDLCIESTVTVTVEPVPVQKFTAKLEAVKAETTYTLGELFDGTNVQNGNVTVTGDGITYNPNNSDWTQGTVTFNSAGSVTLTITDNYYCVATEATITINAIDKFALVFENTDKYLYRVGNANGSTVALNLLFKALDGVNVSSADVEFETVAGNASGTYTPNATWNNGTIQFTGTGVVRVTITTTNANPLTLNLEVVDAVNTTSATNATANNVVLLNDCGLSSLTVSGRYTFYGNGFTMTYDDNGQYLNNGLKQGVVTVSGNGTLDNVRIEATIYPKAYMYYGYTMMGDYVQGGPSTTEGDKTRYHYQLSAVAASEHATISNCYIYGGRTNIFVNTGDVTIKDTVLECGVVANVQIQSADNYTVTLENLTTIQYQVNPTMGETNKVVLGSGVVVGPETTTNPTIVLDGYLKQYNWVTVEDKTAVSDELAKQLIGGALDATEFNHTVNGKTASNLGIIYMNEETVVIKNNTGLPYQLEDISMSGASGQVYSLQNATAEQIYSDYENADKSTVNGLYQPQFKYTSDLGGQYIAKSETSDEFCYRENDTIHVMFPSGDAKELDLAALVNIEKYTGQNLNLVLTCKDSAGNAVTLANNKITLSTDGTYTVTYTVTDNLFYDKNGNQVSDSIPYFWNVELTVSLKNAAVPNAEFEYVAAKQKMYIEKVKDEIKIGSTVLSEAEYKQSVAFLAGLKIYDYNGQDRYLRFDGDNDFNKIVSATVYEKSAAQAAGNHIITVTLVDGGVLEVDIAARADSGGSTYSGTVKQNGNVLYWVNGGQSKAQGSYWTIYSYKFTGNNGVLINSGTVNFTAGVVTQATPTGTFEPTLNATITYDANGGECSQELSYLTSNYKAAVLPAATKSGYAFAGWYTSSDGTGFAGYAGASYTTAADITLYAHWVNISTVTFDANGGTCATSNMTYTGTPLTLPTATHATMKLDGWYTAPTGGTKVADPYVPTESVTLYAHWIVAVEVTLDYNDGAGNITRLNYTGTALTLPTPTRDGYRFNGWYTATSGGTQVTSPYAPTADLTLYAQWSKYYTITVTTSNATVTGVTSGQKACAGDILAIEVKFSQTNNKKLIVDGKTVLEKAGTYNYTMPAKDVTISASSEKSCVTADTRVMLADGTQKRIDEVTYEDQLLVWNFFTGDYDVVPSAIIFDHGEDNYRVINLNFEDGTVVKIITNHGFFDMDMNEFVFIDENNVEEYIGHSFAKVDGDGRTAVKLIGYTITEEYTGCYSIQSAMHNNFMTEGMFSLTIPHYEGWFDYFEIGEGMKYDEEKMQADIEKYGLYTYEDFAEYVTYEQFLAFNGPYLKVLVGRGVVTYEQILELIATFVN